MGCLIATAVFGVVRARSGAAAVCETGTRAFVSGRDLRGMTRFQDIRFSSSPFGGFVISTKGVPVIIEFREERLIGYITDMAIHGRYRSENDHQQRVQGNRVLKWPSVPLKGDIVTLSPRRILEWYEIITSYRGADAAVMHLGLLRRAHNGTQRWVPFRLHLGDSTYAYAVNPIHSAGGQQGEWGFGIDVRKATTVFQMGIWGGRGIRQGTATSLARKALRTERRACGR